MQLLMCPSMGWTLWDFQLQTDKQVMTNKLDIVVVHKPQKNALEI